MAGYDITAEVQELIAAGITWETIKATNPGRLVEYRDSYEVLSRKGQERFFGVYEAAMAKVAAQAAPVAPTAAAAPLATDKQVALILRLIDQDRHHDSFMSFPLDAEGLHRMTRVAASQIIDSMLHPA